MGEPLSFVVEQVRELSPGRALDVACGRGRHTKVLADARWDVTAVDHDAEKLAAVAQVAPRATRVLRDIEAHGLPAEWTASFDLVVMTYFLYRPLLSDIARGLAPGGRLLWETFHQQNRQKRGRPARAHFALGPGEGRLLCEQAGLEVLLEDEAERGDVYSTRVMARAP